jgi:hypothetical protein
VDNVGYVVAGYVLTGGALIAYVAGLHARARRARRRSEALSARPGPNPSP